MFWQIRRFFQSNEIPYLRFLYGQYHTPPYIHTARLSERVFLDLFPSNF